MSSELIQELKIKCCSVKELLLKLHYTARSGHVGSALSCAEILTFVKFSCVRPSDTIILSKGHAASALYSILSVAGEIDSEELTSTYYRDGTLYSAHPPPNKLPSIPFATGSLGHGAGVATGIALAAKLLGNHQQRTYCILSDGELNEGSIWEAFAFAAHHRLNNLVFIIDQNNLQGFGRTTDVFNMEPLVDKIRCFGIAVSEADGHDFESLLSNYNHASEEGRDLGSPCLLLAKTIKGRGLGVLENTVDCHYLPMTTEIYEAAVEFCRNEIRPAKLSKYEKTEYAS